MKDIISERAKTHGDWNEVARISQTLKAIYRSSPNWESLSDSQREAMEMKAVKDARILCGNPNEPDHWKDSAGYAHLGGGL
jgi:hypothetical protein